MGYFNKKAIMGAGAMGMLLGAALTHAGEEIDLIDINKNHVEALRKNGVTVCGSRELHAYVNAMTPDELQGQYDLVFLMCKQTGSRGAMESLLPHLGENSIVCTLQNGMPEMLVSEYIGKQRTVGCAVTWAAMGAGPGCTRATSPESSWHNCLGSYTGSIDDRVLEIKTILEKLCPVEVSKNLLGVRWSKLLLNTSVSGVTTLLGCEYGEVLRNDTVMRWVQEVARECVKTSLACGVQMEPLAPGQNMADLMSYSCEEERIKKRKVFYDIIGSPENTGKASMLQDIEKGRKSEVDYICGLVSKMASDHGVNTPYVDAVTNGIREIEAGKRKPSMENLCLIP